MLCSLPAKNQRMGILLEVCHTKGKKKKEGIKETTDCLFAKNDGYLHILPPQINNVTLEN